ncbi:MAG: hypothetical protein WC604_02145 [Candidatus Gracilibacteria bacterium]
MHVSDLKKNSSLISLIICGVLTVFAVVFSFYTYVSWSEPVPQDPEILQIKLPVMKWAEYSTLSKRYENGMIAEVKVGAGAEPGTGPKLENSGAPSEAGSKLEN